MPKKISRRKPEGGRTAGALPGSPFTDSSPASGLGFSYASNVASSNRVGGGARYNYAPVPNAAGVDLAVTGLRIAPTGKLARATAAGQPGFTASFRVVVR